jgi:hypothetical protein
VSIVIDRLQARTAIPRRLAALGPAVEAALRVDLAPALARAGAARCVPAAVCRVRRLCVRLEVSADDVRRSRLPELWAEAFARALKSAVAGGPGAGVAAAASRAGWIAEFLLGLVAGDAVDAWPYTEFPGASTAGVGERLVGALEANAADAPAILAVLDARGGLVRALGCLDRAHARRLLGVLDRVHGAASRLPGPGDVHEIAAALLDPAMAAAYGELALTDARAIALFVAHSRRAAPGAAALSPRHVRAVLDLVECLCGVRLALQADGSAAIVAGVLAGLRRGRMPPIDSTASSLLLFAGAAQADAGTRESSEAARRLALLLDRLRTEIPSIGVQAARALAGESIETAFASLFLLVPVVMRLQWPERIRASRCWTELGPRALTYVLAGVATTIAGRPMDVRNADRGVLLLAGWTGEPEVRGFERWLGSPSEEAPRELLAALLPGEDLPPSASASWEAACERLAHVLVRRFAEGLRGFRQSSHRFVVERFLWTPGRLLLEPARVIATIRPNPLWPVVQLSGADAAVDSVGWLGGRRLEIELGRE